MAINVQDYYGRPEGRVVNPFLQVLHEPIFYILANVNGKMRELVLKISEDVKCPKVGPCMDFEIEGYRNYLIITDYLLKKEREDLRKKWGLSKEDFKELIFELYCALLRNHTTCGILKRAFLYVMGMWRFYIGRFAW